MNLTLREAGPSNVAAARQDPTTPPPSGVRRIAPSTAPEAPPSAPRYEFVRKLGSGAMGEVILMNDRLVGRQVAVKRLLPDADAGSAARMEREIRTLGRLDHPNIVPAYDAGTTDDGLPFLVMKYVEGETLSSILERLRDGRAQDLREYTVERRIAIFLDVLRALEAAHAEGILHRDVKPSNVMVGRDGKVTLVDWGIAKPILSGGLDDEDDPVTHEGHALVGTVPYMSPEQALGKNEQLDERSDLYSAAALFHELLTLEPYVAPRESLSAMVISVVADDFPFWRLASQAHAARSRKGGDASGVLPCELLGVLRKGLAKEPKDRFQSAHEMIEVISAIADARASVGRRLASAKRDVLAIAKLIVARVRLAVLALVVALRPRATVS